MMSRNRTQVITALAIFALVLVAAAPAEAQIPKNKCYSGRWQLRIEYDAGFNVWECKDFVRFGSTNLNSICFGDKGPYDTVQVVDTVTEISFSGLRLENIIASGGPFSGSALIDRNGPGSSMAGVFNGPATDILDDNGPGPSNGSFIGIQFNCSTPTRPARGTLGEWRQLLP